MATAPELLPPTTERPDLTERWHLRSKYRRLQQRWQQALDDKQNLILELEEKTAKVQQLQDEVDLLLDQIQDADYEHLKPLDDALFSDVEDEDTDQHAQEAEQGGQEMENDSTTRSGQAAAGASDSAHTTASTS
ncbi:hypothetical protein ACM66B_004486 [Microbotryomycetes sp. NB124-2]